MVFAEVELTCKKCGNQFLYKKAFHNEIEADKARYKAAHRRKPMCPACLRAEQEAADLEKAAEMGLPELMGRSDKQISFAFSLRNRYIKDHEGSILRTQRLLDNIDYDKAASQAAEKGFKDPEDLIAAAFRQKGLYLSYLCLTECNAQVLIDQLSSAKK